MMIKINIEVYKPQSYNITIIIIVHSYTEMYEVTIVFDLSNLKKKSVIVRVCVRCELYNLKCLVFHV